MSDEKQKEIEDKLKKLDDFLGYITVNTKFMLIPSRQGTIILGGIFGRPLLSSNKEEMWVAELQIRPARKFVENKEDCWPALTLDQRIASAWGDKDNWKRELKI